MTQEEKDLLLKDLCARLPYSVEAQVSNFIEGESKPFVVSKELTFTDVEAFVDCDVVCDIKPYLRPIESMTEEEREEYNRLVFDYEYDDYWYPGKYIDAIGASEVDELIDFYNKYHFDYRGLISMGLALEDTEGIYN